MQACTGPPGSRWLISCINTALAGQMTRACIAALYVQAIGGCYLRDGTHKETHATAFIAKKVVLHVGQDVCVKHSSSSREIVRPLRLKLQ